MRSKKEYEELIKSLEENGYRKYPPHNDADETWFKGFLRSENVWEEDRCCYQICWSIYDFREYTAKKFAFEDAPFGVDSCIMVSRIIDERMDLQLNDNYDVGEVERIALAFYEWVKENIKIEEL